MRITMFYMGLSKKGTMILQSEISYLINKCAM